MAYGTVTPGQRAHWPTGRSFYGDDDRRSFLGPGLGPADDREIALVAHLFGDHDGLWILVWNRETTEVYAQRVRRGGKWAPGRFNRPQYDDYHAGTDYDGEIRVLGWATDLASLRQAIGQRDPVQDPTAWLFGLRGGVDRVVNLLARRGPPPP